MHFLKEIPVHEMQKLRKGEAVNRIRNKSRGKKERKRDHIVGNNGEYKVRERRRERGRERQANRGWNRQMRQDLESVWEKREESLEERDCKYSVVKKKCLWDEAPSCHIKSELEVKCSKAIHTRKPQQCDSTVQSWIMNWLQRMDFMYIYGVTNDSV